MNSRSSCCKWRRQRGVVSTWVFAGFAVVALFFLLTEHRAHLYGWLPFLLVAACPLMHLFHRHGGHSGHAGHGSHDGDNEPRRPDRSPRADGPDVDAPVAPHVHHPP